MKRHAKPTQFLLRLLLVAAMIFLSIVSTFSRLWAATSPFNTFAYDGTSEAIWLPMTVAANPAFVGDAASVLSSREKKNGVTGNRVSFAQFAEFLAAEETATQLEFNFAKDFGQNSGLVILGAGQTCRSRGTWHWVNTSSVGFQF